MATNKSLFSSAEKRGEIAILRMGTDQFILNDTAARFSEEVIRTIGECVQIVIDMAQVQHLSSSGLANLIRFHVRSKNSGGQVVLFNLTSNVSETIRTSRLDLLFTIASSLEDALAALSRWSVAIACPIAGCEGINRSHERSIVHRGGEVVCRSCGCRFWVAPFELARNGQAQVEVSRFAITTYEQEQICAELGFIVHLHIVGRLDLFASEALVDAMRSLPQSCRALLDLRSASELSEPGLHLLEEHVRAVTSMDRVVVLVDTDRFHRVCAILLEVRATMSRDEAMAVLSDSRASDEPLAPLLVSARTVDKTAEKPPSCEAGSRDGEHGPSSRISAGRKMIDFVQSLFT
jgi:anti-anti-sigma factor